MRSVPLLTYVGQWNAKILWLKQSADFKIIVTVHYNLLIITSSNYNN
jgi:hypothetical protein